MMTERFDILKFLEEYQKYPCLWQKKCADFKNRAKRARAEEALLPVSGLSSVRDLKQKIRNIRCTYNQEVMKIKKSAATDEVYYPKLAWFSFADSFLSQNREENDSELNLYIQDFAASEQCPSDTAESPSISEQKFTKRRKSSAIASESYLHCPEQVLNKLSHNNDNKNDNEWSTFGHFIAQSISRLSTRKRQLKCKHRIMNVLIECEEEDAD